MLGVGVTSQAAGATTVEHDLQCGVNPTTDVRLRSDLTCDQGFRGGLDTPAVNIDLGGHTLTVTNGTCESPNSNSYCGAIFGEASVSNGKVVGDLQNVHRVSRVRVIGTVLIEDNVSGDAGPSLVERSVINGCVAVLGPNATVQDNRISGGGAFCGGVYMDDSAKGLGNTQILGNRIANAPGAGIDVADNLGCICPPDITGVIHGNTVVRSGGAGIDVRGALWTLGHLDIDGNTLRDNAGDGIRVSMGAFAPFAPPGSSIGPVVVTGNRASGNGGHGIFTDVVSANPAFGVVDGGGNVARRNAVAPQCVGVACSPT